MPNLQYTLSDAQKAQIITLLKNASMYDASSGVVRLTINDVSPATSAFAPIYQYIYSILYNNPSVDQNTQFWFEEAVAINSNNTTNPADPYIRGVYAIWTCRPRKDIYAFARSDYY